MKSYTIKVLEVIKAAKDAVSLIVARPAGFEFFAGQHVMLGFPDEDLLKPFSLSSSPTEHNLSITIKNVGAFTERLCNLKGQENIVLRGPLGKNLIFDEHVHKDVVFVAGGTGVCPFMSSLKYALEKHLPNKFILIYSSKTAEELLYNAELAKIANEPNVTLIQTLTGQTTDDWKGEKGRINKAMLEKYVDDPADKLWYVCGSFEMVTHLKKDILDLGVAKENIR